MGLRLDDPGPLKRDLAYLLFLEELLGPEWVERWARERGKLDAAPGVGERHDCCRCRDRDQQDT
jgi:hypothetical protein